MFLSIGDNFNIIVKHGSEDKIFSVAGANAFQPTKLFKIVSDDEGRPYDAFKDINDYLATLGADKNRVLYEQYDEVYELFWGVYPLDEIEQRLKAAIKVIYDIVTVEALEAWMLANDRIQVPEMIVNNESDFYNQDRTYTPEKYKGLIALSIVLKLVIPLWGGFINYITKGTGVVRKEIKCVKLLVGSTIAESKAFNDFFEFIISTQGAGKSSEDSVLAGIGSEENKVIFPATCLFRRIAVAPNLVSKNIVTEAFSYIANEGPGYSKRHLIIYDKKVEKGVPIEEQSILETYKDKESISVGDLEIIIASSDDIELNINYYFKEPRPDLVRIATELRDYLVDNNFKLSEVSKRLMQFFIPSVPADLINLLNSETYVTREIERIEKLHGPAEGFEKSDFIVKPIESLVAVLFTVIVELGYPSIALLVTATELDDDVDTSIGVSRRQITADIDAMLDDLYPIRVSGGKDSINMVKESISRFFNTYSRKTFKSMYTPHFKSVVEEFEDMEGYHYLKPLTPIHLARLTIDIYGEKK